MSRTTAHVLASIAWLFAVPLVAVPLVLTYQLVLSPTASVFASAAWATGFIAIFASWSLKDALEHGKPKSLALAFSAAWLFVAFVAVFPYLFATRGAKEGTVASLRFLSLLVACGIAWLAFPRALALFQ